MNNKKIKYPRTFHLPFSEGVGSDDKINKDINGFEGMNVVVLLKMDGENTTFYNHSMHARSLDSQHNWTRDWAKRVHSVISHEIPENYRLCLENMFAAHSIHYPDGYLDGYLYLLSVWNEQNHCLSWKDTLEYADLFDLPTPKCLYEGPFDIKKIQEITKNLDKKLEEGIVVRNTQSFPYEQFSENVVKWVRKNHVQTDEHWLTNAKQNGLLKSPGKPAFMENKILNKKAKI